MQCVTRLAERALLNALPMPSPLCLQLSNDSTFMVGRVAAAQLLALLRACCRANAAPAPHLCPALPLPSQALRLPSGLVVSRVH